MVEFAGESHSYVMGGLIKKIPSPAKTVCWRMWVEHKLIPLIVLGGGRLSPKFFTKLILSTVRAKLGSPQLSEPYCPPNAVQNHMFESRTKFVF